ncbi:MAG: hypothetical protein QOG20_1477 [Pseudonocardiales bacterium]|jgi:hypothetical protein|nr:hypothetical protein [Pseudonocardiales bacterium]
MRRMVGCAQPNGGSGGRNALPPPVKTHGEDDQPDHEQPDDDGRDRAEPPLHLCPPWRVNTSRPRSVSLTLASTNQGRAGPGGEHHEQAG